VCLTGKTERVIFLIPLQGKLIFLNTNLNLFPSEMLHRQAKIKKTFQGRTFFVIVGHIFTFLAYCPPYHAVWSILLIEAANMIKAARAIIPPKIKGAPGVIYFQRKPAIREEKKVIMPISV